MTEEEAKKVKVGDMLITKISGKMVPVEVVKVIKSTGYRMDTPTTRFHIFAKKDKRVDRLGNPIFPKIRNAANVNWAPENECRKDPVTCNVFADFLEENGFREAADFLRKAFPIATSSEG